MLTRHQKTRICLYAIRLNLSNWYVIKSKSTIVLHNDQIFNMTDKYFTLFFFLSLRSYSFYTYRQIIQ